MDDNELVVDLMDLVIWLARPYGDNRPVFAQEDVHGNPMAHSHKLERTWDLVFGRREPTPGRYVRCPACKVWRVITDA